MPQTSTKRRENSRLLPRKPGKTEARFTVALTPKVARQVERYAGMADTSMSKAIAKLVQAGLEGQEHRKREFFRRLKENLAQDDPAARDRAIDEFRALILGR